MPRHSSYSPVTNDDGSMGVESSGHLIGTPTYPVLHAPGGASTRPTTVHPVNISTTNLVIGLEFPLRTENKRAHNPAENSRTS